MNCSNCDDVIKGIPPSKKLFAGMRTCYEHVYCSACHSNTSKLKFLGPNECVICYNGWFGGKKKKVIVFA